MGKMICDSIIFTGTPPNSNLCDKCEHRREHHRMDNCMWGCKEAGHKHMSHCCVPSHYSIKEAKGYILRKLLEGGQRDG